MKTILKSTMIVALMAATTVPFSGCKKGEGDPGISFRSRKARIAGEWTVTKGSGTSVDDQSNTTVIWTMEGTTLTTTITVGTNPSATTTLTFDHKIIIDKDGTWSSTYNESTTGYSQAVTESGTWNFTGGVGDSKNKSQVVMMTLAKTTNTTFNQNLSTSTEVYTGSDAPTVIWDIYQLKNKEMIVKWDGTSNDGLYTDSDKGEMTMTQE